MESPSYHYRKKRKIKKRWRWAILAFVVLVAIGAGLFGYDIYKHRSQPQTGATKTSQLSYDRKGPKLTIDEPTFSLQLPGDWRETARINSEYQYGITWHATKHKEDNRFMTLYVDKIPRSLAVNRLLPVEAVGQAIRHGSVSENCAAYTEGGSFDPNKALRAKDTAAKWQDVTFLCDLPKVFDSVIGTSSKEGINIVSVTGPKQGKHSYFFVYTDHNVNQNDEILTEIVSTLKAK